MGALGQNEGHTFHLRQKKFSVGLGGWKVTFVSVCVHFWSYKHRDTQTQNGHRQKYFLGISPPMGRWAIHLNQEKST